MVGDIISEWWAASARNQQTMAKPLPLPVRLTPEQAQKPEMLSDRPRALAISQSQISAITGVTPRTVSNV